MAVEIVCHQGDGFAGRRDLDQGDVPGLGAQVLYGGVILIGNGGGSGPDGLRDIGMSVAGVAFYRHEQCAFPDFSRVAAEGADGDVGPSLDGDDARVFYDVFQDHFNSRVTVFPLASFVPAAGLWLRTWPVPCQTHFQPRFSIS